MLQKYLTSGLEHRQEDKQGEWDNHDALNAPIVSVLLQQIVMVEKARIEPAHIPI